MYNLDLPDCQVNMSQFSGNSKEQSPSLRNTHFCRVTAITLEKTVRATTTILAQVDASHWQILQHAGWAGKGWRGKVTLYCDESGDWKRYGAFSWGRGGTTGVGGHLKESGRGKRKAGGNQHPHRRSELEECSWAFILPFNKFLFLFSFYQERPPCTSSLS